MRQNPKRFSPADLNPIEVKVWNQIFRKMSSSGTRTIVFRHRKELIRGSVHQRQSTVIINQRQRLILSKFHCFMRWSIGIFYRGPFQPSLTVSEHYACHNKFDKYSNCSESPNEISSSHFRKSTCPFFTYKLCFFC